jgi:hypothetical protein
LSRACVRKASFTLERFSAPAARFINQKVGGANAMICNHNAIYNHNATYDSNFFCQKLAKTVACFPKIKMQLFVFKNSLNFYLRKLRFFA